MIPRHLIRETLALAAVSAFVTAVLFWAAILSPGV